jgi:hypothetical protein
MEMKDSAETITSNPESWIAWKRRAEAFELALEQIVYDIEHDMSRGLILTVARCALEDSKAA